MTEFQFRYLVNFSIYNIHVTVYFYSYCRYLAAVTIAGRCLTSSDVSLDCHCLRR